MADTIRESFLQQKVDELERELCYLRTAIRNAVAELEEDNIDGARETLLGLLGIDISQIICNNVVAINFKGEEYEYY